MRLRVIAKEKKTMLKGNTGLRVISKEKNMKVKATLKGNTGVRVIEKEEFN